MAYDVLVSSVENFKQRKSDADDEYTDFMVENDKINDVVSDMDTYDDKIQVELQEVQNEFSEQNIAFEQEQTELESEKDEFLSLLQSEVEKLDQTASQIESANNSKYTEFLANAKKEIMESEEQLEDLIQQLDSGYEKITNSSGGVSGETSFFSNMQSSLKPNSGKQIHVDMSNYPRINGPHSIDDDAKKTNPNYNDLDPSSPWCNNCQRCVSAYEARRRGYDVSAQPVPNASQFDTLPYMRHPQGWPAVYKNFELIDCTANSGTGAAMNIEEHMKEWGDGSRAIVRVRWKDEYGGGGHVFIAERTNGVTRYIDPQCGMNDASSHFLAAKGKDVFCMRTDNLEFSDLIYQCCQ